MNKKLWILVSIFIFFANTLVSAQKAFPTKTKDHALLTFGSCYGLFGHEPSEIFYRIADMKSDLWIWLGDVAYLDEPLKFKYPGEERAKQILDVNKYKPEYTKLRETTPMIGVWDDHDFGINNGDSRFPHKDTVQKLWLDFLDEPSDSIRRKRPGLYDSYYVISPNHIKIILLDVRYFKNRSTGDMLGEAQWKWLEEQLLDNPAQYTFMGVGTQLFPDDRVIPEMWLDASRDKLFDTIRKTKASGVVFLSGDVHFAEWLQYPCKERFGFDLYELTSSGLTHSLETDIPLLGKRYPYNLIPETYSTAKNRYVDRNFGVLNITFGEKGKVEFGIRDYDGNEVMTKTIHYQDIKRDEKSLDLKKSCITDTPHYMRTLRKYKEELLNFNSFVWSGLGLLGVILFGIWKLLSGVFKAIFRRKPKSKTD